MGIKAIRESKSPKTELFALLETLHKDGPNKPELLEALSYYKIYHPEIFGELEERVISALGLFYKLKEVSNIYSFFMAGFGEQHKSNYGSYLTPVQASIRRAVDDYQYASISAPTSAGKSYSIRDFLAEGDGDAVIIVPSRSLIAEYINTMMRKFNGAKNVMISSFVDRVYTSRDLRRIFVLTPERSKDLYRLNSELNIRTFFFDEAQISEEKERGVIFDVMVRRVRQYFPDAKLIFAHPFIDNPEAQFQKHGISENAGFSRSYTYGAVGKVCIHQHSNGKDYYFSPHLEDGHHIKNCIEFNGTFEEFALQNTHKILVYVSKSSLYRGDFIKGFQTFIEKLPKIKDPAALETIKTIEHILGADESGHRSEMVSLLRKGVVIHHGSVPLEVRFLVESLIRDRHATLCFATSTLAQGVNMPFDIVWLDNSRFIGNENERALAFKNLIGRSGRLTEENSFDYGYVFTKNAKLFSERAKKSFKLEPNSVLEASSFEGDDIDRTELIDSIRNGTFDDDKNVPRSKVERLSDENILSITEKFLDIIYRSKNGIKESIGGPRNKGQRMLARG